MKTTKKSGHPFREWLDKNGFTVEAFVRAAEKKGVRCNFGTTYKWARGAQPRPTRRADLEEAFPGIRF